MSDNFTEVTNKSWFSRIGNAFGGMFFGLILFVGSFILIFWNEGRAVKQTKTLQEGRRAVRTITPVAVLPSNEGELVFLTGKADTGETLVDTEFGVRQKALELERKVEMFQWKEEKETNSSSNPGGSETTTTTYRYSPVWSDTLIRSSHFKQPDGHVNPDSMPYPSRYTLAKEIRVGEFLLSEGLKRQIAARSPVDISEESLPEALRGKTQVSGNRFYFGENPRQPKVGDVRVSFKAALPGDVSIAAKQRGNTFAPYLTKAGGKIEMLRTGALTADEMFEQAETENKIITWVLRVVGMLLMFFGLMLLLTPLAVLADVVPFLGDVVGGVTGFAAFMVSLALSLFTIAVAWLVYRPLLGIMLIIVGTGCVYLVKQHIHGKRQAAGQPAK